MTDDESGELPGEATGQLHAEIRTVLTDVVEKGPEVVGASWAACAEAGLLGLAAPEDHGGEGLGLAEIGVLVREAGARALDLPFRETLVSGLLTLVRCGTPEQQELFVPRIVSGDLLVAPAVNEVGVALPERPTTRLEDDRLTGRKVAVPGYDEHPDATTLLMVSASNAAGEALVVLVDPASDGITRTTTPSSRGETERTYEFDGAPILGVLTEGAADVLRQHVVAGALLQGDGLVSGARDLTAGYVKERTQFGRQLAEFQGVAMQVADVYVASRMLSLAAEEASRRVAAGEPSGADLAVGAFWFCDRAPAALQTCHHLHGGVGVDETYPLHRIFARVKDVARLLGGAEATLEAVPADRTDDANSELTAEQRSFKDEVRAYFSGLVSPEDRLEMMTDRHGDAYHRTIRQMGEDGWMGVGWPLEYGGKGLGGIEQQIFANEAARADVHLPAVTLQTVGPTLQAYGTELQKDMFLKAILAGEVHFAIGYSEADAGTDLASLRTTARLEIGGEDGDHYVVNGQKMWTTGGHAADYIWLAVRTDTEAPKHKGISVLIVDTKDPGYSWTPIITSDGSHHVNATYYNDVRVPAEMLVGEENEGWRLITTQLNHERVMLGPAGRIEGLRDMVADWARERTDASGTPLLSVPDVRRTLARATAAFRVNELLNWQVAGSGASGVEAIADSSASKVFASDEVQSLGLELERIVSSYGDPAEPETARLLRYLDATSKRNLVLTFGGGVNEVQRELIAMFGLGLPKVPSMNHDSSSAEVRDHDWIMAEAERLKALGETERREARDPVSQPIINAWLDAMEETDPRFTQGVAPPAMAQVWTMPGLRGTRGASDPLSGAMEMLDEAGYTSVLGTNCDQTYERYLRVGEQVSVTTRLDDVAGPKQTGVGEGYFVTTRNVWRVGDEVVASMLFRVLKFKPRRPSAGTDRSKIIRPVRNQDTDFFWEGTAAGELRIQKCNACGLLRHPPGPVCPACHAMDRGFVVASGRGTIFSFAVHHAPQMPGRELPVTIALVELEEGVRFVADVRGNPEDLAVGDPVVVGWDQVDDELTLPIWEVAR